IARVTPLVSGRYQKVKDLNRRKFVSDRHFLDKRAFSHVLRAHFQPNAMFSPPCDARIDAREAKSSAPERVSRHSPPREAKWKPPERAATQISRFGVCRLTITFVPSEHVTVRMPASRSTSSVSVAEPA